MRAIVLKCITIGIEPLSKCLFIFEVSKYLRSNSRSTQKLCNLRGQNNTFVSKCPHAIEPDIFLLHEVQNRLNTCVRFGIFRVYKRSKRILTVNSIIYKLPTPITVDIEYDDPTDSYISESFHDEIFQSRSCVYEQDSFIF
jgi:hypothetical protein